MLIDSHCHLEFEDFKADYEAMLERAKSNGVQAIVSIGTKLSTFYKTLQVTANRKNIFCSFGIHPNNVHEQGVLSADKIIALLSHPKVIGIGETGLDYHYKYSSKEEQTESFINHIIAAQETGLPLIVHTRDADEDTVAILKEYHIQKPFKCLIHCFTSSKWLAEECLKFGAYISISGIATFKNAKDIQEVAKIIPIDKLLVETDAPYLAPTPHRGKRNEPAFVKHTAEFLADLRELTFDEVAFNTTQNFYRLFDKAKKHD